MKPIIAFTFICFFLASVFAQSQTDTLNRTRFEGTWLFNAKESNVNSRVRKYYEGQTLTISYTNPEIKIIERRFVKNSKYYYDGTSIKKKHARIIEILLFTDKRGETNKPYVFNPKIEVISHTNWDEDVLVRTFPPSLVSVSGRNGRSSWVSQERELYSVSKDGKTLTLTMYSESGTISADQESFNTNDLGEIKLIYQKKE